MKYQQLLLPAVLLAAMTATIFAINRSPARTVSSPEGVTTPATTFVGTQATPDKTHPAPEEYVRRGGFGAHLRAALGVLGDRLERPGKERLALTGTLRRAGESAGTSFALIREFSGRLRLEEQAGAVRRVVIHPGKADDGTNRSRREADEIETLAFDTAEHFFTTVARGAAMRRLGDRFRLDSSSPESPSYDLYEITEDVDAGSGTRQQTKVYGLNSETMLLELVRYETERDGSPLKVEVRLGDWRRLGGQMVPHRIERLENGRVMLAVEVLTVAVSPRAADGAFDAATAAN